MVNSYLVLRRNYKVVIKFMNIHSEDDVLEFCICFKVSKFILYVFKFTSGRLHSTKIRKRKYLIPHGGQLQQLENVTKNYPHFVFISTSNRTVQNVSNSIPSKTLKPSPSLSNTNHLAAL